MNESEIDGVDMLAQGPRQARKLSTALVEIVSAAVKCIKQETIVKGFQCCGYDVTTFELNTQLKKAMCKPDGLVEVNKNVNESVDTEDLDDE